MAENVQLRNIKHVFHCTNTKHYWKILHIVPYNQIFQTDLKMYKVKLINPFYADSLSTILIVQKPWEVGFNCSENMREVSFVILIIEQPQNNAGVWGQPQQPRYKLPTLY